MIFRSYIAQTMKFSIKDLFSKCDQIRRKLRIWSHLLKKSLIENFIFYAVLHWWDPVFAKTAEHHPVLLKITSSSYFGVIIPFSKKLQEIKICGKLFEFTLSLRCVRQKREGNSLLILLATTKRYQLERNYKH